MVMDYLEERFKNDVEEQSPSPPNWVTKDNYSFKAWQCIEELKIEKLTYIKHHSKATDYLVKRNYQIKGAEIAKTLNINRSSIMNTSSFSQSLDDYLAQTNAELEKKKDLKIKRLKKNSSRGSIRNSKDELVIKNSALKKRVTELEEQRTIEIVQRTFDQLPLPVKKHLGID